MHALLSILALLLPNAILVSSTPAAALLGPGYPPPINLTSNCSLVSAAWSKFSATLNTYIHNNQTLEGLVHDLGSHTFSVGAFSIFDDQAAEKLQYHHTGKDIETSNTGVTRVDGDSIYHVASVTKVFTVYLTLIEIGSEYWDRPITEFIPELAKYSNDTAPDPLNVVDWKSVTLGSLAGQIAGIPRDTAVFNSDLALVQAANPKLTLPGLPPLNLSNLDAIDPCLSFSNVSGIFCPKDVYFQAWAKRSPVFSPWTTPIYTDGGLSLLSLALENITGRPFSKMFQEDMTKPLGMSSTTLQLTDLTRAVIPGGNTSQSYRDYLNYVPIAVASGGVYSTINDLAKFGLSILNSTLLSPLETRKWLKPISHTGSLQRSVGRPWEIFRITHQINGRVSDLYTKEGTGGAAEGYASYLILSPDHGAGFTIAITGNTSAAIAITAVADILTSTVIPALESQAAAEAARHFAGTYSSGSSSLNSSVTLSVHPSRGAGLHVTSWISNGTDVMSWLTSRTGDELSLFQTDLRSAPVGQAGKVAFRGTFGNSKNKRDVGIFVDQSTTHAVWELVDGLSYGGESLDLFVFDVDAQGNAIAVSPAATNAKLKKVI